MNLSLNQLEKACIDSCIDCLEACTRCAIESKKKHGLESCVASCESCIAACKECVIGIKKEVPNLDELLINCISECKNCADECEMQPHQHCISCAQANRECVEICEDLLESIR